MFLKAASAECHCITLLELKKKVHIAAGGIGYTWRCSRSMVKTRVATSFALREEQVMSAEHAADLH